MLMAASPAEAVRAKRTRGGRVKDRRCMFWWWVGGFGTGCCEMSGGELLFGS